MARAGRSARPPPIEQQARVNLYWAFLLALAASYLSGFAARAVLGRLGVVDRPNERSSHHRPVVRGGGVSLLFGAAVAGYATARLNAVPGFAWIAVAVVALAAVSFLDDLRSRSPVLRFGVQAAAAILALSALGFTGGIGSTPLASAIFAAVGFLWVIGYTNAFNFMDGINGIAGMQVVTTGVGTALVALASGAGSAHPAVVLSVVLAGAGAGFLPHNFPRARMFLGDVGSAPIGFLLAVLAFWLARDLGWYLLGAFGLLHANFVLDTAFTLGRRIRRGDNWLEPHREHFYQRLVRSGRTHLLVTSAEGLLQVLVLVVVLTAQGMGWPVKAAAATFVCALWAAFFTYAERLFRRACPAGGP
jgi:UDP-N-acetylmuramyl pentapeptide phosphotransferase/UDP-N-acetylglucosamine-1-phosphate transferase